MMSNNGEEKCMVMCLKIKREKGKVVAEFNYWVSKERNKS